MADYIIREAAWNGIYNCPTKTDADGYIWVRTKDVAHMIDDIPAADVRPVVRGKWKETVKRIIFATPCACCSACGESIVLGQLSFSDFSEMMRFCPLCGADMREVKTDD